MNAEFLRLIAAFITGALIPVLLQKWRWHYERQMELKVFRLALLALKDEINQNQENRIRQMLDELRNGIAPSYTLSTINRNAIWRDMLRSDKISSHENLIKDLNDIYYEFEHINNKIRFVRDSIGIASGDMMNRAMQGAIALIQRNLENSKKKEDCVTGITKIIDALPPPHQKPRLIEKKRFFVGAILSGIGTLIMFSPNLDYFNMMYDRIFFKSIVLGMQTLTDFREEPSEIDKRQRVKTLNSDDVGFKEILKILKTNVKNIESLNIQKITNRRETKHEEQSKQYIDIMNVIHVYDPNAKPEYFLTTTESNLRTWISTYRNVWIWGVGTALVVTGIFLPYFWQALCFIVEE